MRKIKLFLLFIISAFSISLASCGKKEASKEYKLNYEVKEIYKNDSFKLQLSEDGIILTTDVSFSSSNNEVATVDTKGNVKGVKKGESTINATYKDKTLGCKVSVLEKEIIALSTESIVLDLGTNESVSLNKNNAAITSDVVWSSLDTSIVTVENGTLTPVKEGETFVIAKFNDQSYSLTVKVCKPFNEYGSYKASRTVKEMGDVVFDFELILNSDGTYKYDRKDAYSDDDTLDLKGCLVSEGTYTAKKGVVTLKDNREGKEDLEIKLNIVDGELVSDGEITVENGYTSELTFKKSK